jgi:hypothetical protein
MTILRDTVQYLNRYTNNTACMMYKDIIMRFRPWNIIYVVNVIAVRMIWYSSVYSVIVEANLSAVTIDQCEKSDESNVFNGTNKCHDTTTDCVYKPGDRPFSAGNYWCVCKPGYYSAHVKYDGALVEGENLRRYRRARVRKDRFRVRAGAGVQCIWPMVCKL